ncbi:MAG: amidase [Gemmatimonadetes bacterium]|nr:amidase [Gemmatimonadota bacterium]
MDFSEYLAHDGVGLAGLVRSKEVTALELLETALAAADRLNPALNAIVHRMDQAARSAASAVSGGLPLAGVPFLVKDLVQLVEGEPYRAGSRFLGDYRPDHDSELMARFRRAGLIAFGKTNTPEFGLTPFTEPERFGPSRNPWNVRHTTGGSSGGSAAAVAAGIVPIAGGGDGGGSIRIPAACCGIFGLKPTRGRTPWGPDVGQVWLGAAVDHVLTRTVRDSALVLDATHGPDVGSPYQIEPPARAYLEEAATPPGRLRIAWTARSFSGGPVHPDCVAATEGAVALLQSLGHEVVEASPPIDWTAFALSFLTQVCAETASEVKAAGAMLGKTPTRRDFEPATWALVLLGRAISAEALSQALRFQGVMGRQLGRFFSEYDVLVTPTLAVPPFEIGALQPKPFERLALEVIGRLGAGRLLKAGGMLEQMADQVFAAIPFTPVFNVTGQPAMSVPLAWNQSGLPIGVQVVGRFGDEATLFRLAGQLEQAAPWSHRRPPVS